MLDRRAGAGKRAEALLAWYDRNRRQLPWRALPGEVSDPYGVWLSEIMLQQTTVAAVRPYYAKFLARWPTVSMLAAASIDDVMKAWAGLGYYSRSRNLHLCARAVAHYHGGVFPSSEATLLKLPGIGPYTAAAIAAIAFGARASVIDGNVERVVTRLFAIEKLMPFAKADIRARVDEITDAARPGDFAQAMMDLGAAICTPRNPACGKCPLAAGCAAKRRGDAASFPRKAPKAARPKRRGAVFVVRRPDGAILMRRRAPKGLLGGMAEFPGTDWSVDFDVMDTLKDAPLAAEFQQLNAGVKHVFTHFELELAVFCAQVPRGTKAPGDCRWVARADVEDEALPSLMKKVWKAAGLSPLPVSRRGEGWGEGPIRRA